MKILFVIARYFPYSGLQTDFLRAAEAAADRGHEVTCLVGSWEGERPDGLRILTAQLQDSDPYYDADMKGPVAIVMGTESTGLTGQWRIAADAHIRIPMLGELDSLNVSISAAVLLFEAVRQRQS